jgi:hypothetical protein
MGQPAEVGYVLTGEQERDGLPKTSSDLQSAVLLEAERK